MRIAFASTITLLLPLATHADLAEPSPTGASTEVTTPETSLAKPPELPRLNVDTTLHPGTGRVVNVGHRKNLQAAINQAHRGDTIRVDPRGEWPAIVLPAKPGKGWINIESMALDKLPPAGERVSLDDAAHMPTILNITDGTPRPAFNTEPEASHYRIMGLRFKSRKYTGDGHNKMLMLGRGRGTMVEAKSPDELPDHIIIDRCIIEGWPGNTTRGLYLDGRHVAVIGCQIVEITAPTESHGILITDTPGPILVENNEIAASGVNIFIGQNVALVFEGVNAADITIRGNLLYKRPEWRAANDLKNHFEMKRGERVLFENNHCVYSPVDGQVGFSIKLKTGGAGQYVQDVTIRNNKIRKVGGYIAISNSDPDNSVERVLSHHNDVQGISREVGAGLSIQFMVDNRADNLRDIAFIGDRLRGRAVKSFVAFSGRRPLVERLEFQRVHADYGKYGVKGDGVQAGTATFATYCQGYLFSGNIIYGGAAAARYYPRGNRMR